MIEINALIKKYNLDPHKIILDNNTNSYGVRFLVYFSYGISGFSGKSYLAYLFKNNTLLLCKEEVLIHIANSGKYFNLSDFVIADLEITKNPPVFFHQSSRQLMDLYESYGKNDKSKAILKSNSIRFNQCVQVTVDINGRDVLCDFLTQGEDALLFSALANRGELKNFVSILPNGGIRASNQWAYFKGYSFTEYLKDFGWDD